MNEYSYFSRNSRTTKADILKFLQNKIKFSKIEKLLYFTVNEWGKSEEKIIQRIKHDFSESKIIIRSSAIGEDSLSSSMAGNYLSVPDIDSASCEQVKNSINSVICSYTEKRNNNLKNQILIQTQTTQIVSSGVIFSNTPDIGAPYYIINFEDGSSTDQVTKGLSKNSIKIFRKCQNNEIPKKWNNLINAVKEIESVLQYNFLDIEFGIRSNGEVIIFQVRPITSINEQTIKNLDEQVENLIKKNIKKYTQLRKNFGSEKNKIIFSDMADWNPAEIIGSNPNFLDFSLYRFLITDKSWYEGRKLIGYQNLKKVNLMEKFGNKPYINVNLSFNSLIPKKINKKIVNKLIVFYLNKLEKNPQLHDKIEFEILFSCYELTVDERLKELKEYGFISRELKLIKNELLKFTNDIIESFPTLRKNFDDSLDKMSENREKIIQKINTTKNDHYEIITYIEKLLLDARKLGTIQFSAMARIAFMASAILKSLKRKNIVSDEFIQNFMNSLKTPLSEIQNDLELYSNKKMSKKEFLGKYGHLRPGTYDILAMRYDKNKKIFDDIKYIKKVTNNPQVNDSDKIEKILLKNGLDFREIGFLNFVREALEQRERLKFEFTKNLSYALELISMIGKDFGISKTDLSNLDIKEIINGKDLSCKKLKEEWKKKIRINQIIKSKNNFLQLPPIIFNEQDFKIITHYTSKPNFITDRIIDGELIYLSSTSQMNPSKKIVLIENADPGYDWIFTKEPKGLITKYGGVASHMAIRCSELRLPAAIGCGEILFEKIYHANKILLDCKNEQIFVLQNEKLDEHMEEKKILKFLGYIK